MTIQVVTISVQDLQGYIAEAYKEGYVKAQREWEAEKAAAIATPKFNEILRGVKELRQYLMFKGYWSGSVSTLSKVAPQLLADGDKQGHGLIFRCGCIDHDFANGFRFKPLIKGQRNVKARA